MQALGRDIGFTRSECHELAIVVSELVSNIVKYGIRGKVTLEAVSDAARGLGIAIVAEDVGPQFHDLTMAIRDGYDDRGPIDPAKLLRRGGLGTGLGAVVRLTHSFHVDPLPQGKRVCATRYLKRPSSGRRESQRAAHVRKTKSMKP